jgi:hypothetical protein
MNRKPYVAHVDDDDRNQLRTPQDFLNLTCEHSPIINQTLKEHGKLSLIQYLQYFTPNGSSYYQSLDDLIKVVRNYAAPLLGDTIAQQVSEQIVKKPIVLAANHHGVDYFSHSVQGSLIFSLDGLTDSNGSSTVPVFSCGNIPLDNATYPRGLLLYNASNSDLDDMPRRLPIFSDRQKRQVTSVASAFDEPMIQRAKKRFEKMLSENQISENLAGPLRQIFREDYMADLVVDLENYSQQSVVLNNRVWKRLFSDIKDSPEMVYLELEKIVGRLLSTDLSNPGSLASYVMFDSSLREAVLQELDGATACWNTDVLEQRLRANNLESSKQKPLNGSGTHFFWGIDTSRRRIPLYLDTSHHQHPMLRGVDDRGDSWELSYRPSSILDALNDNRLLPSLFTCFTVLSFARGINCLGGYFKDEYFPIMKQGMTNALRKTDGYGELADLVELVPTMSYLSGMIAIMAKTEDDCLIPAGPIEIIAGGGITKEDLEKIKSLTIRDAHLAGLFETIPDFAPWVLGQSGWKRKLAQEMWYLLSDKVVIK